MNTRLLRYAVEVEHAGSITKAAENLYMSQPNLSKALRELESEFGITIFNRTSKGIEPTTKGAKFLRSAKRVLEQLDDMEAIFTPDKENVSELDIALPRSNYLMGAFTHFVASLDRARGIRVRCCEADADGAIGLVGEYLCDIAVIRYQAEQEYSVEKRLSEMELKARPLLEFESVLLTSANGLLAAQKRITKKDLKQCLEISGGEFSTKSEEADPAELRSERLAVVHDRECQLEMLSFIGDAYMISEPLPEKYLGRYGLLQKKLTGKSRRCKDELVYRSGHHFTKDEESFLMFIRSSAEYMQNGKNL